MAEVKKDVSGGPGAGRRGQVWSGEWGPCAGGGAEALWERAGDAARGRRQGRDRPGPAARPGRRRGISSTALPSGVPRREADRGSRIAGPELAPAVLCAAAGRPAGACAAAARLRGSGLPVPAPPWSAGGGRLEE